eukprot:SAG11_NODE_22259_length_409_cov_0.906452_1_plen_37_part_10
MGRLVSRGPTRTALRLRRPEARLEQPLRVGIERERDE